jgi:glyoxylase-like metal-dependent hydrolase (beta-lactamase superfamily II)
VKESVAPSSLGTQPIGEVSCVVDGIYQLKLPVPFPLKFIASYLVEGCDGWTVIDSGFDYPPAREAWESGAVEVGVNLDHDVERIVVTHLHPDHIGLARWLEERSGTPVWMLEGEIENARHVWDPSRGSEDFVKFLIRNGMDAETAESTAGTTRLGIRLPERLIPLRPGDTFELGDGEVRVVHTPGHSDFHFVLHDERRRLLFAGDHLLLKITPNIGLWTYTAPRPLERYLDSIKGLQGLGVELVFRATGRSFTTSTGASTNLFTITRNVFR